MSARSLSVLLSFLLVTQPWLALLPTSYGHLAVPSALEMRAVQGRLDLDVMPPSQPVSVPDHGLEGYL